MRRSGHAASISHVDPFDHLVPLTRHRSLGKAITRRSKVWLVLNASRLRQKKRRTSQSPVVGAADSNRRYLVIPQRPSGTDGWTEAALAVTRDVMVRTAAILPR
jgi:Nitrile hydratase, alpha chain